MDSKDFVMLPFVFLPASGVWVHGMSPHEAHRSFWLIRLFLPRFFSRFFFSMATFAGVVCSSITLLQLLEPRALWLLQARVNFKGVEKFFLSCCLQDKALKLVSETFWDFWL
jgi:hypothetical protein